MSGNKMNTKTILLIEDNKQDEILTLKALKKHDLNHDIVICRDGAEALDWIFMRGQYATRNSAQVPTVTLLDLKLPKKDGHEVLAEMRSSPMTKKWPVVILTSSREESDLAKSYESGANSYVQKPVDFNAFSEAVRNLGVYWLFINIPPEKAEDSDVRS
jgi:two-component system, response regulator